MNKTDIQIIQLRTQPQKSLNEPDFRKVIAEALVLIGIKEPPDTATFSMLYSSFADYNQDISMDELRVALRMNVGSSAWEKVTCFGMINVEYITDVIKQYRLYRSSVMKRYLALPTQQTDISDDEKERRNNMACEAEIENMEKCIADGTPYEIPIWMYDYMKNSGMLNFTDEQKEVFKRIAKENLDNNKKRDRIKKSVGTYIESMVSLSDSDKYKIECRSVALKYYFKNRIESKNNN